MTTMGFTEIKPQIERLSHDEQVNAMAVLKHLWRSEKPEYHPELAQRHADIEAARGVSLADAKKRSDNA